MTDGKKLSMSELIAKYNELATAKGLASVTEFKNLAAARAAVQTLENKMTETANPVDAGVTASDSSKYASTGKRGPTQGVGAFAKGLIVEGKTNPEILAAVKEKFPDAKTTTGCIAYYRTALKNPGMVKAGKKVDVDALRAKAAKLLADAEAAEVAAAAKATKAAEVAAAAKAAEAVQPA